MCCLSVNGISEETAHDKATQNHTTKRLCANGWRQSEKLRKARICHSSQTNCGAGEAKQIPEICGDRQGLKSVMTDRTIVGLLQARTDATFSTTCFLFGDLHHQRTPKELLSFWICRYEIGRYRNSCTIVALIGEAVSVRRSLHRIWCSCRLGIDPNFLGIPNDQFIARIPC